MSWLRTLSLVAIVVAILMAVGCSQPAAAPTPAKPAPTTAPTAAPAAAAPTKAPAPQPTAVPTQAPTVNFPEKGKSIRAIITFAAGGITDVVGRIATPMLEKELGVPIMPVNNGGAGTQIGVTEVITSKPDGYTLGLTVIPSVYTSYLDPTRKAPFGRQDIQPLAMQTDDPLIVAVLSSSPYKTLTDLIDAAKAKPGQIKGGVSAILSNGDLGIKMFQQAAGVEFGIVHFDQGAAPVNAALLGGHVDFSITSPGNVTSQIKSGEIRVLGVMGSEEIKLARGVKTLEAQGFKVYMGSTIVWFLRSGVPREVQTILRTALKKVTTSPEFVQKADAAQATARYMDQAEFENYWDQIAAKVKPLLEGPR